MAAADHTAAVGARTKAGTFLVGARNDLLGRELFVNGPERVLGSLRRAVRVLRSGRDEAIGGVLVLCGEGGASLACLAVRRVGFDRAVILPLSDEAAMRARVDLILNDVDDLVYVADPGVALADALATSGCRPEDVSLVCVVGAGGTSAALSDGATVSAGGAPLLVLAAAVGVSVRALQARGHVRGVRVDLSRKNLAVRPLDAQPVVGDDLQGWLLLPD